jgi:hypothetical protein
MPVSHRALQALADALRQRPRILGSQWRRLATGEQALLVLAHLNKGETYTALAGGFGVGTTTVSRGYGRVLEPDTVRKWRSLKIKLRSVSSVRAVSNPEVGGVPGGRWRRP